MSEPRDTAPQPVVSSAGAAPAAADAGDGAPRPPVVPVPPEPQRQADTGLSEAFLCDLALKHVYQGGSLEAIELADELCLAYPIVADLLAWLKEQELVATRGGSGAFGGAKIRYGTTERGTRAAVEALARDGYHGPAPVPIAHYARQIEAQSLQRQPLAPEALARACADLVLAPEMLARLGPAIASGRSIFLYGAPGNGKTALAERITRAVGGRVFVPRALALEGGVVRVFDELHHTSEPCPSRHDRRWVYSKRPVVIAGGELTLQMLDLGGGRTYYEAPLQVKANSGVLVVDDFGRQRCDAAALLNRWTLPLERQYDFITFPSGHKAKVPFDGLVVFSTNLDPATLADEAFLRRIRYKIEVGDPSEAEFVEIFRRECDRAGLAFDEAAVAHLLSRHYRDAGRPLRACQPRDFVDQLLDQKGYTGTVPAPTAAELDRVATLYFVGHGPGPGGAPGRDEPPAG
jgi:predicted ATPase with chaperone activity